jgi:hypothetical protein
MEKSLTISAYKDAYLIFDDTEGWRALTAEQYNVAINTVITTFGEQSMPIPDILKSAPILIRDKLCNWVGVLVSREGRFNGPLPLLNQPTNQEGQELATFLHEQFVISSHPNARLRQHG